MYGDLSWIECIEIAFNYGPVTYDFTLHLRALDRTPWFWKCLGTALAHFFWALTVAWSRLLARVWSGHPPWRVKWQLRFWESCGGGRVGKGNGFNGGVVTKVHRWWVDRRVLWLTADRIRKKMTEIRRRRRFGEKIWWPSSYGLLGTFLCPARGMCVVMGLVQTVCRSVTRTRLSFAGLCFYFLWWSGPHQLWSFVLDAKWWLKMRLICPALLAGLARSPRHRTRFSTKVYIKIVSWLRSQFKVLVQCANGIYILVVTNAQTLTSTNYLPTAV